MKIIVADDHTLFRAGLVRMLASFEGVNVVAQAASATEVLAAVRQTAADLLTLDLSMPGASGVSLIEGVHALRPTLPILVLSMHDEPPLARQALKAGASGYVTKDVAPEILFEAISKVGEGGRYVAPGVAESLAFDFSERNSGDEAHGLTAREREVLQLIAERGLSLVEVAERLGLSPKTVTTHKTNIMSKLGVANNVELIRYVVDHKLFG